MSHSEQIRVPAEFRAAFDDYCRLAELSPEEVEYLRAEVRKDFAIMGPLIQGNAKALRWAIARWGRLPTMAELDDILAAKREECPANRAFMAQLGYACGLLTRG